LKTKLLLAAIWVLTAVNLSAQFAGGTGTINDPFQVQTIEHLQLLGNFSNFHFVQINDIDASETLNWNDESGFLPIGTDSIKFKGSYDGRNYHIHDLYINRPNTSFVGLFGIASKADIKNVNLTNVNIIGGAATGAIAGWSIDESTIYNCSVTGVVQGINSVGGLVGSLGGNVSNSRADCNVKATLQSAGGLVGSNGGIISNSFSIGNVTATFSYAGGLVGVNWGNIINSYSHSDVSGLENIGGLVGLHNADFKVVNSFSTGNTTAQNGLVGGFIGVNEGDVENCYWDMLSSGQTDAVGSGVNDSITGLLTEQMINTNAYENMPDFGFGISWKLTENYPGLNWEDVEAVFPHVPTAPVLLSPVNDSVNLTNTFTWEPPIFSENFKMQISSDIDYFDSLSVIEITDLTEPEYTTDVLEWDKTYFWRVLASNNLGEGSWSEKWKFSTLPEFHFNLKSGTSYCYGDQIEVEVNVSVERETDNAFILQLSDKHGSFDNAVTLAQKETTSSFVAMVSVPDTLEFGTAYSIRVKSTNPEAYTDSLNFIVYQVPTATIIVPEIICSDNITNIVYTGSASANASYNWFFDGGTIISGTDSGPYDITWPNDGLKSITLNIEEDGCSSDTLIHINVDPQTQPQPICIVTVSESNKNMIVWEQPVDNSYDSVAIYKESSQADVYYRIGIQHFSEPGFYVDNESIPSQNSSRYKLGVINACGNETTLSEFHKTIHLTINAGMNGAWNLIWDKYEGFEYSTFLIYRGTGDGNLTQIAEQASNTFTYTDLTPPVGTVYYQIAVVNPDPCNVSSKKSSEEDYFTTKSNIVNSQIATSVPDIELNHIRIWPNPVNDALFIELENTNKKYQLTLTTIEGRVLLIKKIEGGNTQIDITSFPKGVYNIKLCSGSDCINRKVVIQ
jgi:hypothetical protein